jgi:branched-chain amino acid transport system permease protein
MTVIFRLALDVVLIGSLYGLFSLALTLIFGVLDIANMAFGATSMIGAFGAWFAIEKAGWPLWTGMLAAVAAGAAVGAIVYSVAVYPLFQHNKRVHFFAPLLTTIAAAIIITNAAEILFGPSDQAFNRLPIATISVAGLALSGLTIGAIVASLVIGALLWWLVERTSLGLRIRAVQSNRRVAALFGISVPTVMLQTFIISSAIAGLAGALIATAYDTVSPHFGETLLFLSFAIVMLGGLGNVRGALVAAFLIAAVDVAVVTLLPSEYEQMIAYGIVIVAVAAQSRGYLGARASVERV